MHLHQQNLVRSYQQPLDACLLLPQGIWLRWALVKDSLGGATYTTVVRYDVGVLTVAADSPGEGGEEGAANSVDDAMGDLSSLGQSDQMISFAASVASTLDDEAQVRGYTCVFFIILLTISSIRSMRRRRYVECTLCYHFGFVC